MKRLNRSPGHGIQPGRGWRVFRRVTQSLALITIVVAPFLGGWQRLERNELGGWDGHGWDLPSAMLDRLPGGEAARGAYDGLVMSGGGTAVEYFGVPILDPVAGALSVLFSDGLSWRMMLAWGLPIVLAIAAGRVFCGWFCPFGFLARGLELLVERLPWQPPRFAPPKQRWARFGLLAGFLIIGALGAHTLLYLALPHLLVQQSIYGMWLMGGGGAALGALGGILLAGMTFGPLVYCESVCPTGAALALLGRNRVVRLQVMDLERCGKHCDLCDHGCWLSLTPSQGDAGLDCDNCARCVEVCPKANLRVRWVMPWRSRAKATALGATLLLLPATARTQPASSSEHKTKLLLQATQSQGDTDIAASIIDLHGLRLDADAPEALEGIEVSIFLARGTQQPADERGRLPLRKFYRGPLELQIKNDSNDLVARAPFEGPNYPESTPNRSVYRRRVPITVEAGDVLELPTVPGWTTEPTRWEVPQMNAGQPWRRAAGYLGVGFLLLGGFISVALVIGPRRP